MNTGQGTHLLTDAAPEQKLLQNAAPEQKLLQIADHAIDLLIERGYKHMRMSDVAKRMKFSEAALYRYVESKDALTYLAFRSAIDLDDYYPPIGGSFNQADRKEIVALVGEFLRNYAPESLIPRADRMPPSPQEEFRAFVSKLYVLLHSFRQAVRLIEKVGLEWPEIYAFWYQQIRPAFFKDITRYLSERARQGIFVKYDDELVAATIFTETLFEFAVNRHFSPVPIALDESAAERSLVTALTRMFVLEE